MKYVSIDIETTGLDLQFSQILEFGAVIEDTSFDIRLGALPTFHRFLNHKWLRGQLDAIVMNTATLQDMQIARNSGDPECIAPEELGIQFAEWLHENGIDARKVNAAGKNAASFDIPFLRALPYFDEHVQFRHRVIDPSTMFAEYTDETLPNTEECLRRAGLPVNNLHRAVPDALDVIRLLRSKRWPA